MEQFTQDKEDGTRTCHCICEYSYFPVGPRNIASCNPHYVGRFAEVEFTTVSCFLFCVSLLLIAPQFPTIVGGMDACYQAFDKDG